MNGSPRANFDAGSCLRNDRRMKLASSSTHQTLSITTACHGSSWPVPSSACRCIGWPQRRLPNRRRPRQQRFRCGSLSVKNIPRKVLRRQPPLHPITRVGPRSPNPIKCPAQRHHAPTLASSQPSVWASCPTDSAQRTAIRRVIRSCNSSFTQAPKERPMTVRLPLPLAVSARLGPPTHCFGLKQSPETSRTIRSATSM